MNTTGQVVVALDVPGHDDARTLVRELDERVHTYKVGLQLLTSAGPQIVEELVDAGKSVFLDLKLHEIPHSVASAVRACGQLGVSMVTVHASAGSAVLRAAVEAGAECPDLHVLGLTVITSHDDQSLAEVGVGGGVDAQVQRLACLSSAGGCHGLVASPRDIELCRALMPPGSLIVVPGVSLRSDVPDARDHARSGSIFRAITAGATHVLLGRSITQAPQPVKAVEAAAELVTEAEAAKGQPSQ